HVPVSQAVGPPPLALSPVPISPALTNGVLYAASPTGIAAYSATDGTVAWHYPNREIGPFLPQPVLVSGVIYVNAGNGAVALRASDGTVLWQSPGHVDPIHPLLVTDGVVIGNSSAVYGLRASDGSQIWQSTFTPEGEGIAGPGGQSLAVGASSSGGVVY